ncbi:MAG: symmetrical bis(5'-nucleosyl)-tetraphosphatase [Cocleimonas sp.]|nr:symmetrical bis(5'-nucleosyl)-tetraphosphatase [Cocleimonas sp.]
MANYAIGDIQGCYDPFRRLLDKIQFTPGKDTLWIAGDLVNRGNQSLEVLRFIKSLDKAAISVLGNHDVSLIASHYGLFKPHKTLKPIFSAPDREELVNWLRNRPFLHVDKTLGYCMAHAGISPFWTLKKAIACAEEIQISLRGNQADLWLKEIYGNKPAKWRDDLKSYKRHRYILNSFVRMRYSKAKGALNFHLKKNPFEMKDKYPNLMPWFLCPIRKPLPIKVIFGHWSSLGFYQDENVIALDTGCVWNNKLTAIQLNTEITTSVECP